MLVVKMNECSFFQNTEHCFILQSSHSKSFARFRTKADLRSPVVTQQEKKVCFCRLELYLCRPIFHLVIDSAVSRSDNTLSPPPPPPPSILPLVYCPYLNFPWLVKCDIDNSLTTRSTRILLNHYTKVIWLSVIVTEKTVSIAWDNCILRVRYNPWWTDLARSFNSVRKVAKEK